MTYKYFRNGLMLLTSLLQPILLTSCAEEMEALFSTPIQLTASSVVTTRTAADTDIQTSTFDAGETINAYFYDSNSNSLGISPTTLTTSAASNGKNSLTPDVQVYYPNTSGVTVNVHALYPETVTDATENFTVLNDQTSNANYKTSDLMYASLSNLARTASDVNLLFDHKMAKVIINATGEEGVTISQIRLLNVDPKIGFTPTTGALGSLGGSTTSITIATGGTTTTLNGTALFPPQTINADFIEVTTNYGTAVFSVVNKEFTSGTQYTADITVTRQSIGFTTTITDWDEEEGSISVVPGTNAVLLIGNVGEQTYTGGTIEPKPVITYTENSVESTLTEGVDYDLQYFNNVNTGTATIIITGSNSSVYEAVHGVTALKSFVIKQKTGTLSFDSDTKEVEYTFNGTVENTLNTGNGDGTFSYSISRVDGDTTTDVDKVATVSQLTGIVTIQGVGTCKVTATMADDGNYTAASASYVLTVTSRSINNATLTVAPTEFYYNGNEQIPSVLVTDGGRTLTENTHYTLDITSGRTDVGTYTITVAGMGVYDTSSTKTETYEIKIVTPTITMDDDDLTLAVGFNEARGASSNFGIVTLASSAPGVATVTSEGIVKAVAVGNATITATVTGNTNYTSVTKSYNVSVVDPDITFNYIGDVQTWTCPVSGRYYVDVWGAQGAGTSFTGASGKITTFSGGKGAHIRTTLSATKGDVLYVWVGGKGNTDGSGGWNGGGSLTGTADESLTYCGGGGATDISTNTASSWSDNAHLSSRILVAGGGGGAMVYRAGPTYAAGGHGGAYNGGEGGGILGGGGGTTSAGGTTSGSNGSAGSFGIGGSYSGSTAAGMGGGGYYGGGSGGDSSTAQERGAGGGGSSYVNTTRLTEVSKTAGAWEGDGKASFTYIMQE